MNLLALLLVVPWAIANKVGFTNGANAQVCAGVYSKHDWGGSFQPKITIRLNEYEGQKFDSKDELDVPDLDVSYVIFEFLDLGNIGLPIGDNPYDLYYLCDDKAIDEYNLCDSKQRGKYLLKNVTNTTVLTSRLTHLGYAHINYEVNQTGYYCIQTVSLSDKQYKGEINFQNAFGHLAASEIPKLPAYGILTICYAIGFALFGFQFYKKRKQHQILPLQRYLLAFFGFLTFDTIVVWSYYDLLNRSSNTKGGFIIFYMVFLSLLNSIKLTFAFFLLLCISLGYGVVVMKLPKKIMLRCKILAGCQFSASLGYLINQYYIGNFLSVSSTAELSDDALAGLLGLLPIIPITITLTVYYISILVSIKATTATLHKQRQIIKLQLYDNLFKIIFFSVLLTFGGLVLSSFIYLSMSTTEMMEEHWKGAFFLYDFWKSVVFFLVFMGIAWLWRPTETSYMLAISQQLSTEETDENYQQGTEFELDDLSLMSHDEEEGGANDFENDLDNDSFELDKETQKRAPPSYANLHEGTSVSAENPESNTLFELGDDDSDHEDDRINGNNKDEDSKNKAKKST